MLRSILAGAILSVGVSAPAFAQECLHGPNETTAERARREQAVRFAHPARHEVVRRVLKRPAVRITDWRSSCAGWRPA